MSVWLGFGLMLLYMLMLYAWVSPRWAIFGGMLALTNVLESLDIGHKVTGVVRSRRRKGLMLGGIERLIRQPYVRDSLLTGAGFGILAIAVPLKTVGQRSGGVFLLLHIINQRERAFSLSIRRIVAPIVNVFALALQESASTCSNR